MDPEYFRTFDCDPRARLNCGPFFALGPVAASAVQSNSTTWGAPLIVGHFPEPLQQVFKTPQRRRPPMELSSSTAVADDYCNAEGRFLDDEMPQDLMKDIENVTDIEKRHSRCPCIRSLLENVTAFSRRIYVHPLCFKVSRSRLSLV